MPQTSDEIPLNANGGAYISRQDRHGVPLLYVAEKLGCAIEDLHRHAQHCPGERDALRAAMYHQLVAYLALHNMLGKANDHTLADRLLNGSCEVLETWLRLVAREGDVRGLAELDNRGGVNNS